MTSARRTWVGAALLCAGLTACGDDTQGNRAPEILTAAPTEAVPYHPYVYDVACADADGDLVTLTRGDDDTCGGAITDHGNRTATYELWPEHELAGTECTLEVLCADAELSTAEQATISVSGAPDVLDLSFEEFEPWAEPIADYISEAATALNTWDFYWGIHDLAVHDHRLYIGYGDATHNVGSLVPIEIRSFTGGDPGSIQTEFVTDEEQISHYRQPHGRLLIPGVDATEDNLMGQVYTLDATGWSKRRSLSWGVHVEDTTMQGDDIVACGSGAPSVDVFYSGNVHAYLWRYTPDATGFVVDTYQEHPQNPQLYGDHRLTRLLEVGGELYATGYYTNDEGYYAHTAYRHDGSTLVPWDALGNFAVFDSLSLSPALGLLFGVDRTGPLVNTVRVVTASGVTVATGLTGRTTLNADPLPGGRALILAREGDTYPSPADGPWDVTVGVTTDGGDYEILIQQSFDVLPRSIAFWRRSLYLGLDDGSVWRAWGTPTQ